MSNVSNVFLKACRKESTPYTPIWLMRQAGRYMKDYRDVRERHSFKDLCKNSDLACEVTLTAVERLGVDAAILFSDILLILEPMGLTLEYTQGDGPQIQNPVRKASDVSPLRTVTHFSELGYVGDAVHKIRKQLAPEIALIGFSGAPFTLASYLIEGAGSKNYITTKSFMYTQPAAWDELMTKLSDSLVTYVNGQIQAGADAIQLFDSWVGCLSPADYERFVLPYMKSLVQRITPNVPVIYFGTQTSGILELMKQAGTQVMGVDWRVDLDVAWSRLGDVAIQGNLDPVTLFSGVEDIQRQAKRILNQANGRSGHIFNLGHGIFPQTPVDHVRALVDYVHCESSKQKELLK